MTVEWIIWKLVRFKAPEHLCDIVSKNFVK